MGGSTEGYTITPLPTGIGVNYDPVTRIITLSGTPTDLVTSTTVFPYSITTSGTYCSSTIVSGTIEVEPQPTITLMSAVGTDAQVGTTGICMGSLIQPITYEFANNASIDITGLPPGVSSSYSGNKLTISGTPNPSIVSSTIYSYTVTTTGSGCQPEASMTGSIEVHPLQLISLSSAVGTDNQTICNSGPVAGLVTITYRLGGSTQSYNVLGLPAGLTENYDPLTRTILISGSPSQVVTRTTEYNYSITTSGTYCTSATLSGKVTVEPSPIIRLTSAALTANQVGVNGVCVSTAILPIVYEIENSSAASVIGLPNGVTPSRSGNRITISGTPNVSITSISQYSYTIRTQGSSCKPEASISGTIEVIPLPIVDVNFITDNDLTHISCNGGSDGSIIIPPTSPDFDLRIQGLQSDVAQVDQISLINPPNLGDVYSISINGNTYQHTVIATIFGGAAQSEAEIAAELVNEINSATGALESQVTASIDGASGIRLTAKEAGVAFTTSTQLTTSYLGLVTPTIANTNTVSNVTRSFSYAWTGPNGFSSSNLSISNLSAGVYYFQVNYGSCSTLASQASFTIEEPDSLQISTTVCNGAFEVVATGGVSPYTFKLFDSSSVLIQSQVSNGSKNYTGLIPGANYLIEVTDSQCIKSVQKAVYLPFNMMFDSDIPLVVSDYCNDSTGNGFIELGGGAKGDAFSGGSGQYAYEWTGTNFNANTRDIYNLQPGNYLVTVTDKILGCKDTQSFTIGSVDQLSIQISTNTVLDSNGELNLGCSDDSNAVIQVVVSGGLGSYSYSWTRDGNVIPSSNTPKLENLIAGDYELTVSDAPPAGINPTPEPCQISRSFVVNQPDELQFLMTKSTSGTICLNNTGTLNFEVFGGVAPFTLKLNGKQYVRTEREFSIDNLDPLITGPTYTAVLIDANGCEPTNSPDPITFTSTAGVEIRAEVTDIDCASGVLGSIALKTVNGSTISEPQNTQVQWISADTNLYETWEGSGARLDNIKNPGTYLIKVTSKEGCELFNEQVMVGSAANGVLTVENPVVIQSGCSADANRIELEISGGNLPYKITWEQYKAIVVNNPSSPSGTTTSTTSTSSVSIVNSEEVFEYNWVPLSNLQNNAIVTGLEIGTYRAIISDNSNSLENEDCGGTVTTRNIIIGESVFEIENFSVDIKSLCSSRTIDSKVQFNIINNLTDAFGTKADLTFSIDGSVINNTNTDFSGPALGGLYVIRGLADGAHTLNVSNSLDPSCQISYPFEISSPEPITYTGLTKIEIEDCVESTIIDLEGQIKGGSPYLINGQLVYQYSWKFTSTEGVVSRFVGPLINQAYQGIYELSVYDSNNCTTTEPIIIEVTSNFYKTTIAVAGALQDPDALEGADLVKSIAPTCSGNNADGQIGINVTGGTALYTIRWYKEDTLTAGTSTDTSSFIELTNYKNATLLSNLDAGRYRLIIQSDLEICKSEENDNPYAYYEEDIVVSPNKEFHVIGNPFPDTDLCKLDPGYLSLSIFNSLGGELTFYYDNQIVESESLETENNIASYVLRIPNPKESAILKIINSNDCSVEKEIKLLELGEPNFNFTSPSNSLSAGTAVLAREEVTFSNITEGAYISSIWSFGDGTDLEEVDRVSENPTSIRHTYPISGTYFVTLRVRNLYGCDKEITKVITVGRGFNVLAPNVFSPNNDGINDKFSVVFSGFSTLSFSVFNNRGNLLYIETVSEPDPQNPMGLKVEGWDGENSGSETPYYVYAIEGQLLDEKTTVVRSGTFIILR